MAQINEHGRLIAAAAKAALAPLGCRRKGQSRFWFSDQRFWIISIEFQPSGWSKGSYLNVGGAWLWHSRSHFGFNTGYRVADFIPFENAEQFSPLIEKMAQRAADEVIGLRKQFRIALRRPSLVGPARYSRRMAGILCCSSRGSYR